MKKRSIIRQRLVYGAAKILINNYPNPDDLTELRICNCIEEYAHGDKPAFAYYMARTDRAVTGLIKEIRREYADLWYIKSKPTVYQFWKAHEDNMQRAARELGIDIPDTTPLNAAALAADYDDKPLSELGRMSDEEYRAANDEQLRRWAERNEADNHRPARQHPEGL